jgi:NAD(P)-dependent dehydrogenase (short-subunit alcohol dehydrogenase family)
VKLAIRTETNRGQRSDFTTAVFSDVGSVPPAPWQWRALTTRPEGEKRADAARTALRRLGRPGDVASAALFFASDLAAFVTG